MSLLEVNNLTVTIGGVAVVDRLSFAVDRDERLGIIGESGSGKTLSALAVTGLTPDSATVTGSIRFDGVELVGMPDRRIAKLRGEQIATVFQNPLTSLNPLMRVGRQISESLRLHDGLSRTAANAAALELAARVGLPDPANAIRAYPHQLSGGQRQRVGIAIAIAAEPRLLIADEPTTALDVTVQAEIIALLDELIADQGTALIFITHDIALVSQVARSLLVMRHGSAVERGSVDDLIRSPRHPYTAELIAAARATSTDQHRELRDEEPSSAWAPDGGGKGGTGR